MSSTDSVKRKRGRPRKPAAAKKKTIQKDQPVQLTIAAYGRRRSSPSDQHTDSSGDDETTGGSVSQHNESLQLLEEPEPMEAETPIVLSIPVSDTMEDKLTSHHTLDEELTSYRADNVVQEPKLMALVSGTSGHPVQQSNEHQQKIAVKRCPQCVDTAGPCNQCLERFNSQFQRTLSDYERMRVQDDCLFEHPDPGSFRNIVITDEPLPRDFSPPEYNHRRGLLSESLGSGSRHLQGHLQGLQGYSETGWDETTATSTVVTQEQREKYQQEELERLRRKVSHLEELLASPTVNIREKTPKQLRQESSNSAGDPLDCMWHLEPFDWQPVGLPIHYDPLSGSFDTIGRFCSLQCAYAYRLEHRSAEGAPLNLLHQAHRMLNKENPTPEGDSTAGVMKKLVPARPRQALKRWGGKMDVNEFLNGTQRWYSLVRSPFIPSPEFIEASDDLVSVTYQGPSIMPQSIGSKKNDLVRRREKPHPNAANQWEHAIRRSKLRR